MIPHQLKDYKINIVQWATHLTYNLRIHVWGFYDKIAASNKTNCFKILRILPSHPMNRKKELMFKHLPFQSPTSEIEARLTINKQTQERKYSTVIKWQVWLAKKTCKNARVIIMVSILKMWEAKVQLPGKNNWNEIENLLKIQDREENSM